SGPRGFPFFTIFATVCRSPQGAEVPAETIQNDVGARVSGSFMVPETSDLGSSQPRIVHVARPERYSHRSSSAHPWASEPTGTSNYAFTKSSPPVRRCPRLRQLQS